MQLIQFRQKPLAV